MRGHCIFLSAGPARWGYSHCVPRTPSNAGFTVPVSKILTKRRLPSSFRCGSRR
ncbi:hypothetical protein HMPREF0742_02429 [Rothia aeria F0184]|uniref:Uncharacterized protein n=1 Tax=Rothia aeria F0184 TaxID=888019 RepID=U7UYS6_9MICC|nr:hypothetical protein HMPREF0742_02429 [Rothia aeria F0184]